MENLTFIYTEANMQVTFVEYHSLQWSILVERGFVTADIETWQDGKRMARMIRERVKYYPGPY